MRLRKLMHRANRIQIQFFLVIDGLKQMVICSLMRMYIQFSSFDQL